MSAAGLQGGGDPADDVVSWGPGSMEKPKRF